MKLVSFVIATWPLLIVGGAAAADLHPIVEVQSGYLFGASSNGKWMKPEEAIAAIKANVSMDIRFIRSASASNQFQGVATALRCLLALSQFGDAPLSHLAQGSIEYDSAILHFR